MAAGSKCSRSTPLLGLAFLTSAITAAAPAPILPAQRADEAALRRRAPRASPRSDDQAAPRLAPRAISSRLTSTMRLQDVAHGVRPAPCVRRDELVQLGQRRCPRPSPRAPARCRRPSSPRRRRQYSATPALSSTMSRAGPASLLEHRQQHRPRLLRRFDLERAVARHRQAEVLGMDLVLARSRRPGTRRPWSRAPSETSSMPSRP